MKKIIFILLAVGLFIVLILLRSNFFKASLGSPELEVTTALPEFQETNFDVSGYFSPIGFYEAEPMVKDYILNWMEVDSETANAELIFESKRHKDRKIVKCTQVKLKPTLFDITCFDDKFGVFKISGIFANGTGDLTEFEDKPDEAALKTKISLLKENKIIFQKDIEFSFTRGD